MSNKPNPNDVPGDDCVSMDDWQACPAGELLQMACRLQSHQRRTRAKKLVGATAGSMALVAATVLLVGSLTQGRAGLYGGISCAFCQEHFGDYHTQLTANIAVSNAAMAASMEQHLAKCKFCRAKFKKDYPGVLDTGASPMRPLVLVALRPAFAVGGRAVAL